MPLFDKVKAQASQVAQKAQEAGKAGQAKLDQAQAKRKADALLRDLGAAVYAERSGQGSPDSASEIDRLIAEIASHEAEHGSVSETTDTSQTADAAAPAGDFKLE